MLFQHIINIKIITEVLLLIFPNKILGVCFTCVRSSAQKPLVTSDALRTLPFSSLPPSRGCCEYTGEEVQGLPWRFGGYKPQALIPEGVVGSKRANVGTSPLKSNSYCVTSERDN